MYGACVAHDDGDQEALILPFRSGDEVVQDPQAEVFEEMLAGFAAQQRSRSLKAATVYNRAAQIRRFMDFCNTMPWDWTPSDIEEWTTHMVSGPRPLSTPTIRGYQSSVALFCAYLTDGRYGWGERCMELFGTHPVQICHEWNTTVHTADHEARPAVRPLTRLEVQQLLDHADDEAEAAMDSGRKGWATAMRDAALFKVIYAFGLRRREAAMLDLHDFTRNPSAPEFGRYGVCNVRWGKAARGSVPRRRAVVSVFDWTADVLRDYVENALPEFQMADSTVLWPTERQGRMSPHHVSRKFSQWRDELGLDPALHPHCLRHSYVTHLIEDGFDPLFVQQQVGHRWGTTTALYTGVSGDYRNQVVRQALNKALLPPSKEGDTEP